MKTNKSNQTARRPDNQAGERSPSCLVVLSDTPRTDKRLSEVIIENEDSCCAIYVKINGVESDDALLDAGFARELEREITMLRVALGNALQAADSLSEQQALPDDGYRAALESARSAYSLTKKK